MKRQMAPIVLQQQPAEEGCDPALKLALTPEEAAQRLSMGRTLFDTLLASNAIKAVRIGSKKVLIPVTELQAFLDRNLGEEVKTA